MKTFLKFTLWFSSAIIIGVLTLTVLTGVFIGWVIWMSLGGLTVSAISLGLEDEDDDVSNLGPTGMKELGK